MASLVATIPQYLFLTLQIYALRSLLLVLSALDWIVKVTSCVILAVTASMKKQTTQALSVSKQIVQPEYRREISTANDVEDSEESFSDSDDSNITWNSEDTMDFVEDGDDVQALASDLEFLVDALAEGIQSFANGERFLVQSDDPDWVMRPSTSSISLSTSESANSLRAREYSAITRPHTPRRFSLQIDMTLLRYPSPNLSANFNFDTDYPMSLLLSQRDCLALASIALSAETSTTNGDDNVTLSPALLWAPNTTRVKIVLALPRKRSRRRKAAPVVVWSNEGEYGDLKKALQEAGR